MSTSLPPSLVTFSCYQPIIQKHSSLSLLKLLSAPNSSSLSSLRNNDLKNATNNSCKSMIRASGTTISFVTVEKDVTDSIVFVIRAKDKRGFLDVITKVLKGIKVEKPIIQFDAEEECFVIKFIVTDLNGNKIEDEESLIKIESALTEAISVGVVLRKPGFVGGKSKTNRMFELMDGFLKNDPDSL